MSQKFVTHTCTCTDSTVLLRKLEIEYNKLWLLGLNTFYYCYTVDTSDWLHIETLKPHRGMACDH